MEYKGWKIPEKLYIYAEKKNRRYNYPQAMIASSNKPEAIDTAKRWASGKYYNYTEDDYIEYIIDNKDIKLEILDSAKGSSQGGKLSFWNCLLSKDDMKVVVGIGSDLLLELLKSSTFINGKCEDKLIMARIGQHWGALHEKMEQYKEAIRDIQLSQKIEGAKKTSKWDKGYEYYTKTTSEVYLYNLYVWRALEFLGNDWWGSSQKYQLVEFSKPKIIKVTEWSSWVKNKNIKTLSQLMENGGGRYTSEYYKEYLKLQPKIKGDKILDIDLSPEEIDKKIKENRENVEKDYFENKANWFSYLIGCYGVSATLEGKPELPDRILEEIKKRGVKIINE
jgi:hypothetical protein|nr:MAG TPA: hypothetical protein [Caudoviricetes sp.]